MSEFGEIRLPTPEEEDQERAFRTFSSYAQAWVSLITASIPEVDARGVDAIKGVVSHLSRAGKFNGQTALQSSVKVHYQRGAMTLRAISDLPVDDLKNLACSAVMWLPVQSYYALHAFGLVLLASLNYSLPQSHEGFLNSMVDVVRRFFPFPLNVRIDNDGHWDKFRYHALDVNPKEMDQLSNLTNPTEENRELFVAKSLKTTRTEKLEREFREARKSQRLARLLDVRKSTIAQKQPATTILDLFYRLRVKSNYEDARMFLHPLREEAAAYRFYKDYTQLTNLVCQTMKALIEIKVGQVNLRKLERS